MQGDSHQEVEVDDEQRRLVETACEAWIRRLVDHSRGNSLLFFRHLKVGTLNLSDADEAVSNLLVGNRVNVDQIAKALYPDHDADDEESADKHRADVKRKVTTIQRKALGNSEERGLDTLYLAAGLATWPAGDGGRPYKAPVLLLPAKISQRGQGGALTLHLEGDPQANIVLEYVMEQNHRITLDSDEMVARCTSEIDSGWQIDPNAAFEYLTTIATGLQEFHIEPSYVLGNFQFAKMAMVEDLRRHREELIRHPIIAAIANHGPSREWLASQGDEVAPRSLDDIPPVDEHLVLDADSSQHSAIASICSGRNGVIQGPPGTGKSQTIANLIAELSARGQKVLFVAEKRAALDAVLKRLREVDLGHLALDLHGASVSRKEVMGRINDALQAIRASVPPPLSGEMELLEEKRSRLNEHAERVNIPVAPLERSVHDLYGQLLGLHDSAETLVRVSEETLARITEQGINEYHALISEASSHEDLFLGSSLSPWKEAHAWSGEAVRDLLELARSILSASLPRVQRYASSTGVALRINPPSDRQQALKLASLFEALRDLLARYSHGVLAEPIDKIEEQLRAATTHWWTVPLKYVFSSDFRRARKALRQHRSVPTSARVLAKEAQEICLILQEWQKLVGESTAPHLPEGATEYGLSVRELHEEVSRLTSSLPSYETGPTFDALYTSLQQLLMEEPLAYTLPRVYQLRQLLDDGGLGGIIEDFRRNPCPSELWCQRLNFLLCRSALDSILVKHPEIAAFQGRYHDQIVDQFAGLDIQHLNLAADRIKRLHGERAVQAMNQHPVQRDLVNREAHKRNRHIPLRRLLAEAPDVLTRVAPCWVASPLSVSQLLDGAKRHFDVVVFDEASQVLPEDAVTAIMRGTQVVVAGDRHQLPPTTFFAGIADESEEEKELEAISGFESLLDSLSAFLPNWLLEWHYRSQDERLIAFSNEHVYSRRLVTFPGTLGPGVISHIEIPFRRGKVAQEDSCSEEVQRIVSLVLEHAEENLQLDEESQKSLGVITMGIRHANRVQAALDRALEDRPDLLEFFGLERAERFFVKNLETVQGDERDTIILSIGYGKTPEGDLPHRFGPLTQDVGYRRLNVAITRAKSKMTAVSSFSHHEINLDRAGSRGVRLLKAYLEYAASGGVQMLRPDAGGGPLNAFEADIRDALEARGVQTIPQYGSSRYRIDLAAMHPDERSRPVLAIECDGAAYHSSATARERDRLRQEHLMRLGWRFHRIWSTDWFNHREGEIERAVKAYNEAVERGAPPSPPAKKTTRPPSPPNPRGPAPVLPSRANISEYTDFELVSLARWVMSDGQLRTDEEVLNEMFEQLPFRRRGARIRSRLQSAVAAAKRYQQRAS